MPVTIKVNGTCLSLVHKMSNGISMATIPDVCKTPTPGGPVPIPYPNIAQSITLSNGTTTVKSDKVMAGNKGSKFSLSNGDNAGTIGGIKSNVFMKEATWLLYSFDVKMDNKNTCRLTDPMYHNSENTVNMSGVIQAMVAAGLTEDEAKLVCQTLCDVQDEYDKGPPPKGSLQGPGCCSKELEKRLNALKADGKLPNNIFFEESFLGAKSLTPDIVDKVIDKLPWSAHVKVSEAMIKMMETGATTALGGLPESVARVVAGAIKGEFGSSGIGRPDIIIDSAGKRTVFDAKFSYESRSPGRHDGFTDDQIRKYRRISKPPNQNPNELSPESCGCPGYN